MVRSVSKHIFLIVLFCSLMLIGCRNKSEVPASEQEAETAASLTKLRSDLTKAKRQQADLIEELNAVKDIRDELDKQVAKTTVERDDALKEVVTAEQKINELTVQIGELPENLSALEKELNERNILIENQQATISEQQAAISEQQKIIKEQEETIAALEKIIQEQTTVEVQPQEAEKEEIPELEPEVERQE